MFFEQYPIPDALWTIGVFVAAWCLATFVMAFLGYCIHNGLWWTEPRRLDLNVTLAPRLEVDGDARKALGSSASSSVPSLSSDRKPEKKPLSSVL